MSTKPLPPRARCSRLRAVTLSCALSSATLGTVTLALVTLAPRAALAQDKAEPEAAQNAEVETLVQRGIELRRAGKDDEALVAFQQAEKLAPTIVRTRVHLAATHQALGHWLEADEYLRGVLAEPEDPYVERHRQTLERALEYVDRHIGELEVSGGPAGATVRLNGRELGTLPLSRAVRVPVGTYELEVSHDGYYAVRRPVVLGNRGVVREAVDLAPTPPPPPVSAAAAPVQRSSEIDRGGGSPRWLSWTLTGLAVAGGATTTVALLLREKHADNWNSADCLQQGFTRGDVCRDELDSGRTAERIGYVAGIATAVFAAGAIVSWSLGGSSEAPASAALDTRCGVTLGGAMCQGSF
jgi:PEGA domain-containing protein